MWTRIIFIIVWVVILVCVGVGINNHQKIHDINEKLQAAIATLEAKANPSSDPYLQSEAARLLREGAFRITIIDGRNGAGYTVEVARGRVSRIYRDYSIKTD